MNRYLLSIDNGLTTTKAVLFNMDGEEIESELCKTIVENKGEYSEINMELQWENTAKCIKNVIEKSGIDTKKIAAVGNSGHGAGVYMLDTSGKPFRKAITSMDSRASKFVEAWEAEGRSSYVKTLHPMWAGQAIPILRWLKDNEPENYKKIDSVFAVKDWIKYKLTGKATTEYTDATNSGLVNIKSRDYDDEMLELFGIGEIYNSLAPLYQSKDIVGYVTDVAARETGLDKGTPVTGGLFDVVACALGSGVYDCNKYSIIAGTWNINSGIEKRLVNAEKYTKCSLFADGANNIYVESSATSAVNLEWFIENLIRIYDNKNISVNEIYKNIDAGIAGIRPDESDILYLPFLHNTSFAKGVNGGFIGIKAEYDIYHMLRAVFEGVCFAHLMHIENLQNGGIKRDSAVLSGGASNSDAWCQIFSDILHLEIITMESSQAGALGVAANTGIGIGIYKTFEEAARKMVKVKKRYHPGSNYKIYKEKYIRFKQIIAKLSQ